MKAADELKSHYIGNCILSLCVTLGGTVCSALLCVCSLSLSVARSLGIASSCLADCHDDNKAHFSGPGQKTRPQRGRARPHLMEAGASHTHPPTPQLVSDSGSPPRHAGFATFMSFPSVFHAPLSSLSVFFDVFPLLPSYPPFFFFFFFFSFLFFLRQNTVRAAGNKVSAALDCLF